MSKIKLQRLLTEELELEDPVFKLERIGTKLAGSVISPTFRRKSARTRLHRLWAALDKTLGTAAVRQVGTILMYTPEEWNIDLPDVHTAKAV